MDEIESVFHDGLRQAVVSRPPLGRIDVDEVVARAEAGVRVPAHRRNLRWVAAVAALAVVAALGTGVWVMRTGSGAVPAVPLDSASGSTASELQLAGSSWQAIQIGGRAVVASSRGVPSLTFTSGTVVVAADPCNGTKGTYLLEGSSPAELTFSGWGPHTDVGCEIAQQQRFTAALAETREARLVPAHGTTAEDVLELRDADGTVVLQLIRAVGSGTPEPTGRPESSYRLRVHNGTGLALDHVRVQPRTGDAVDVGPLGAEATSSLVAVPWVDDQAVVTASADGRSYRFTMDAYRGEAEWKPSDYTYTLLITPEGRGSFSFSGWGAPSASPGSTQGAVQIRIRNASDVDFASVEVDFPDGGRVDYGPLSAGSASAYADAGKTVYPYARVMVGFDGRSAVLQPTDYVGEQKLAPGEHTYVLAFDDEGHLILTLE